MILVEKRKRLAWLCGRVSWRIGIMRWQMSEGGLRYIETSYGELKRVGVDREYQKRFGEDLGRFLGLMSMAGGTVYWDVRMDRLVLIWSY